MRRRVTVAPAVLAVAIAAAPAGAMTPADTGTIDLAGPDVTQIAALAPDAGSGRAVVALGDVNGDRVGDFAINSPRAGSGKGVVQVVFASSNGKPPSLDALGSDGFEIDGSGSGSSAVVAPAGDVNGDGLADVLIGNQKRYQAGGKPGDGTVYVVFGKKTPTPVALGTLGGPDGFRIVGGSAEGAGASVAAVGDLDADGRPEIAVGAPAAVPLGRLGAGRVAIVLSSRRTGNVSLATAGSAILEIYGAAPGDAAGRGLAALPDVNGDGRPDLAVGAPGPPGAPGSVAIVHLPPPDSPPVDLAAPPGAVRTGVTGENAGTVLTSAGDRDGDGVGDLLVGVPTSSPFGRVQAGAVYLVSGTAAGPGPLGPGLWLAGGHRYDRLGTAVDAGGAMTPGALPAGGAVAVGAPIKPPQSDRTRPLVDSPLGRSAAGAAWVVFPRIGPAAIDLALPPPSSVERLAGPLKDAHSGTSVALLSAAAPPSVLVGGSATPVDNAVSLVNGAQPPAPAPAGRGCGTTNIEVIIDDSSSMPRTDPDNLRKQALDMLLTKPSNAGRVTGAVEFAASAEQIFQPLAAPGTSVGPLHDRLEALLDEHLLGDVYGTNYNAGFVAGAAQNPEAGARIFITDGGHGGNGVPPFDIATAGDVPTYVIGVFRLRPGGTDDTRLRQIAEQTHGAYFGSVTAGSLGPVLDTIDALALACGTALPTAATAAADSKDAPTSSDLRDATAPTLTQDQPGASQAAVPQTATVTGRRPIGRFTTDLSSRPAAIDVTLNWEDPDARFDPNSLKIVSFSGEKISIPASVIRRAFGGHTVRSRGMSIKGSRGASYLTLHITGVARVLGRAAAHAHAATLAKAAAQMEVRERQKQKTRKRRKPHHSVARAGAGASGGIDVSEFVSKSG